MDKLIFRRQFLFSSKPTNKLKDWQYRPIRENHLYVHPELELHSFQKETASYYLMGYWLDPHQPNSTNQQLLEELFGTKPNGEAIHKRLNTLVGRFVLIISEEEKLTVYHDACGLRTVYYTKREDGLYMASQPGLLKIVLDLEEAPEHSAYFTSNYVKTNREHWLPCGITLYKNVHQLVPNHYLDTTACKQIRYWPNPKHSIKAKSSEEGVKALSCLLMATMSAANNRFGLALAITAGLDSRLMLSASKHIAKEVFFYTLEYRDLTRHSVDINIPKTILTGLGYGHTVIECKEKADQSFLKIYERNTANSHLDDWGTIAYGIHRGFPANRIAVKANCVEIGRNAFLRDLKLGDPITVKQLFETVPGWKGFGFVKDKLALWLEDLKEVHNQGYDVRDLFYMELRLGSWQAQNQLEWDICQDVLVPFNNREVIEIMFSVDPQLRSYHHYPFFTDVIKYVWPELLDTPINPKSNKQKIKRQLKSTLTTLGLSRIVP